MLLSRSRLRTLRGHLTRVARMEANARRLRRADAELVAERGGSEGTVLAVFEAPGRLGTRRLPAREVPLRTPWEHRDQLRKGVIRVLQESGVPFVDFRAVRDGQPVIALRSEDWNEALRVIALSELPVLLGGSRASARTTHLRYRSDAPARARARWTRAFVLDPAVAREGTEILARYSFDSLVRLERWEPDGDGAYRTTIPNMRSDRLFPENFTEADATYSHRAESDGEPPNSAVIADALHSLHDPQLMEVTFPIDVVYTWVDGTDPDWLRRKRAAVESFTGHEMTEAAADDLRFVDHDELRYSLRSIELYAPWVRNIYLVTDRQCPDWLRRDHPRLRIVDHTEIAPAGSALPTFNSHAIEANLHRIEGLSEHFLYFNDDVFLSSPVPPDLFFSPNGIAHMYLSKALVAPGEPEAGEPASDAAGKNARAMVQEVSGRRLSRKLFHAPFALRRSVSEEIEQRWPEAIAETRASTFRRTGDITLSGALHMNYAYATGRAVTRALRYRYVNVGAKDAAARLQGLERDRAVLYTFCLNEADPQLDPGTVDRLVRDFLRRRFPDRSTFEVSPGSERGA